MGDTTVSETLDTPVDDLVRGFDPDGATVTTFQPFAGEHLGRYMLGEKLAQGSFGYVFRAFDLELDREVALKVLNPDHANKRDIVRRFLQEAHATSLVSHPGVVTVLDSGQHEDGSAYIAMDLLDGESLTSRLESCGRMLPQGAIEVARQIASALEAAHAAGVLHRDLKPDNIFVVNDPAMPDGLRIKVLDFGLAKVLEDHGRSRTGVQSVMGTPRYMSPEQCRSATAIDHRSDIYALGCILFELVTGSAPFEGDIDQVIEAHLEGSIPRASALCGCSPHLDELIIQLMAKDPARRPQTMTAVRRALDKLPRARMGSAPLIDPPHRTPLPRVHVSSVIQTSKRLPALPKPTLPPPLPPPRLPRASSIPPPLTFTKFVPANTAAQLPPYFPRPPTVVEQPMLPTPMPSSMPSMSTALAMNMAYVPPVPTSRAPSLLQQLAVPLGLPAPAASYHELEIQPLPKLPIVLLAIVCALVGVLAALLLV
jgi:serine/threonine protein kinase